MTKWDDLKAADKGYYTVAKADGVPTTLAGDHPVAWVYSKTGGTRGAADTVIEVIIDNFALLVKGIFAIIILAEVYEIAVVVLKVDVTTIATDKQNRPTLITDDRGNVYTIEYDASGGAHIVQKANPNDWLVNVAVVVAVALVTVIVGYILLKYLKPHGAAAAVPATPIVVPVAAAMAEGGKVLVGEDGPEVIEVKPLAEVKPEPAPEPVSPPQNGGVSKLPAPDEIADEDEEPEEAA